MITTLRTTQLPLPLPGAIAPRQSVPLRVNTYINSESNVTPYRKFFKRTTDLAGSVVLLCVLSPLMFVTGCVVWASCGHVFFVQERVGYSCRKFKMIKFCTMNSHCGPDGELLPDAERCTRIGDFVRRHSLDELPQLVNVIKGEMSLVGPRPFMECYVAGCSRKELRRHTVKPGMTGLAQVEGRNSISYKNRFRYDVWYADNYSFRVDVMILCATARMVLGFDKKNNATSYNPAIEEKFRS